MQTTTAQDEEEDGNGSVPARPSRGGLDFEPLEHDQRANVPKDLVVRDGKIANRSGHVDAPEHAGEPSAVAVVGVEGQVHTLTRPAVSIFGSVILFGAKPAVDSKGQEVVMKRERKNVLKEVATVLKMAGTPRMACLTPLFLCLGFQSIFVNSMYNRQIDNKSNIALFMIVYTVTEVVCGFIHGWCIDTVGLFPMLVLYAILGVSALLLSFWADRWQSMVFIPLYLLFSVTDSGLQTFVASPPCDHA